MDPTNDHNESTNEPQSEGVDYEPKGVVDLVSVLYVVCGIPCMILFFLLLFGLVGACDSQSIYIPA
jgi:hypothetical protein